MNFDLPDDEFILWTPGMTLEALEKKVIRKAYRFYNMNKYATADALGVYYKTIENKIVKYREEEQEEARKAAEKKIKNQEYLLRARGLLKTDSPENIQPQNKYAEPLTPDTKPEELQVVTFKKSKGK